MASTNLGRIQGASIFTTSADSGTQVQLSTIKPTNIRPLVEDSVVFPNGDVRLVTGISGDVVMFGAVSTTLKIAGQGGETPGGGDGGDTSGKIYGVRINVGDHSVEYTDDAVGFMPARGNNGDYQAGDIDNCFPFNAIRACEMTDDGEVARYLEPDEDWQNVYDDVMIEIPLFFYKIEKSGNYINVKISETQHAGFVSYGFNWNGAECPHLYVAAFLGTTEHAPGLRSHGASALTVGLSLNEFREAAHERGDGYEIMGFRHLTMLQVLFLLQFCSLDSQTALGMGLGEERLEQGNISATTLNYGSEGRDLPVRFLGIESFYGSFLQWIDGIKFRGYQTGLIMYADLYGDGDLAPMEGSQSMDYVGGYISNVVGDNSLGFVPSETNASEWDGFCDMGVIRQVHDRDYDEYFDSYARFGGSARPYKTEDDPIGWENIISTDYAGGAFAFFCDSREDYSDDITAARLVYHKF